MQVFRLMGMPDKVIAFDSLPDRLLVGLDMTKAEGFPRHWKEWMGKQKRIMRIPPERNPLNGEVRTFKPIEEEDYFFYLVDWNIRSQEDRWKEISDYVRLNAPQDMRIPEKLQDMAKPLAKDKLEAVALEPEEVPVIPLPKAESADAPQNETITGSAEVFAVKCDECVAEFKSKQAVRMHKMKKHPKVTAAA
jgi:hypothetical protein